MLFFIIERLWESVVNFSLMLIYDRIADKLILVSNVYFLTEDLN